MKRTLSGKNTKSDLTVDKINKSLMEQACIKYKESKEVFIIHDPSDIRKPHSKDAEDIGKVRDLKGNIINGYNTHNIIGLTGDKDEVTLLSNITYSNRSSKFLDRDTIKKIESGKASELDENVKLLYDSGDYYNKKTITISQLKYVSESLKRNIPLLKLTHVLDREFDDDEYINYINNNLGDYFVIRSKRSRTKADKSRLIDSEFENCDNKKFQKLNIKKKCVQDGSISFKWSKYGDHYAIKVSILNKDKKNVFDDSMLLLTNKKIENIDDAYAIYKTYLLRSKIEYVFKFLKEGLGWEDMQINDFESIQKIISLAFYAAAYLYDLGDQETYDDFAVALAEMADGKGKVTRHFILKGIQILMSYCQFELYRRKKNLSDEYVDNLKSKFTMEL